MQAWSSTFGLQGILIGMNQHVRKTGSIESEIALALWAEKALDLCNPRAFHTGIIPSMRCFFIIALIKRPFAAPAAAGPDGSSSSPAVDRLTLTCKAFHGAQHVQVLDGGSFQNCNVCRLQGSLAQHAKQP
jgi:hypothetical protein